MDLSMIIKNLSSYREQKRIKKKIKLAVDYDWFINLYISDSIRNLI